MLNTPATFAEALADRAIRDLLPTTLGSAELMQLSPAIRRRAVFSARVDSTRHLTALDTLIQRILDPDHNPDGTPRAPGQYMNEARARQALRTSLDRLGYTPTPGTKGTIKDLRSEPRIRLQLQMPIHFARNYGTALQHNDPAVLDQFPGQRLLPSYADEPRPNHWWLQRWQAAGLPGPFGTDWVALRSHPGWSRLSIFGHPYPPFDWGSKREVEPVDRATCESYGLIQPGETPAPMPLDPFDHHLTASIGTPSPDLLQVILHQFPNAQFDRGTLTALDYPETDPHA